MKSSTTSYWSSYSSYPMQILQMQPQNCSAVAPPRLSLAGDGVAEFMGRLRIPMGYRFQPTDEEIINEYLVKKINNQPLPPNLINTAQVYASTPDHLTETFRASGEGEWYFFTPRDRKYKNGRRVDRTAGGGHWRPSTTDTDILHNGEKIGGRTQLNYFKGTSRDSVKTDWLMQEFRVINSGTTQKNSMRLDDWVVCKMYKRSNAVGSARKRKHNGEVNNNTEAIQLSVDSSIANASPSSSASSLNGSLHSPEGIGSVSIPSIGWPNLGQNAVGNIYGEAKIDEGNDYRTSNTAKRQHVESPNQISTARSNALHMLLLPAYCQQFPNSASELESRYGRADHHSHLHVQQGHYQLNVEHQASSQQPVECHDHQQGPAFKYESDGGVESYWDHF